MLPSARRIALRSVRRRFSTASHAPVDRMSLFLTSSSFLLPLFSHTPPALGLTEYLCGRVALVSGGTGALGAAIAHALAVRGARVAVVSRNHARCVQLASALPAAAQPPNFHLAVACDVTNSQSVDQCVGNRYSFIHNLCTRLSRLELPLRSQVRWKAAPEVPSIF
jgi:hypothetical protein